MKPFVLNVIGPIPNVKCQREVVENIVAHQLIVLLKIVEHGLFVSQKKVVLEVIVDQKSVVVLNLDYLLL